MANPKTLNGGQYYAIKRIYLQQEGTENASRHLKTRHKFIPFAKRKLFRWERRPNPDKGTVEWNLWITNSRDGKKQHGIKVVLPLGKICTEGWGFVARAILNARKELRNGKPKRDSDNQRPPMVRGSRHSQCERSIGSTGPAQGARLRVFQRQEV